MSYLFRIIRRRWWRRGGRASRRRPGRRGRARRLSAAPRPAAFRRGHGLWHRSSCSTSGTSRGLRASIPWVTAASMRPGGRAASSPFPINTPRASSPSSPVSVSVSAPGRWPTSPLSFATSRPTSSPISSDFFFYRLAWLGLFNLTFLIPLPLLVALKLTLPLFFLFQFAFFFELKLTLSLQLLLPFKFLSFLLQLDRLLAFSFSLKLFLFLGLTLLLFEKLFLLESLGFLSFLLPFLLAVLFPAALILSVPLVAFPLFVAVMPLPGSIGISTRFRLWFGSVVLDWLFARLSATTTTVAVWPLTSVVLSRVVHLSARLAWRGFCRCRHALAWVDSLSLLGCTPPMNRRSATTSTPSIEPLIQTISKVRFRFQLNNSTSQMAYQCASSFYFASYSVLIPTINLNF